MTDLDRLDALARACVQAAHEVAGTDTAGMLESAHRFLSRADPEVARLMPEDQQFNRRQMYRTEH
jgi:hypothetical protein